MNKGRPGPYTHRAYSLAGGANIIQRMIQIDINAQLQWEK